MRLSYLFTETFELKSQVDESKYIYNSFYILHLIFHFLLDLHEWNQGHIKFWLKKTSEMFNLPKIPSVQKFPKTGKELSELSR